MNTKNVFVCVMCVIILGKLWFSVVSDYDRHELLKETELANSQSLGEKIGPE